MLSCEPLRRAPRRLGGLIACGGMLIAAVGAATLTLIATPVVHAAAPLEVSGWSPYFAGNAAASMTAHASVLTESNPFLFTATSATSIGYNTNSSMTQRTSITNAAVPGKPVVATVVDAMGKGGMAAVLADPVVRAQHETALVTFAGGFSGVDLDYESFAFSDGSATWAATYTNWGTFLTELSAMLHANGKTLEVSVPPIYNGLQASTSGYWVYNYPTMVNVVDRIKVMLYAYSVGSPGPNAPYAWVSSSIDAIVQSVPGIAAKLVMGIPAYGTDWVTGIAGSCPAGIAPAKKSITTAGAAQYAFDRGVDLNKAWVDSGTFGGKPNQLIRERSYSYVDTLDGLDANGIAVRCNVSRTVWYDDATAIYQRALLAQSKGIVGITMWALGYEDSTTWDAISHAQAGDSTWLAPSFAVPAPRAAPNPPIVASGPLPARYLDTRKGFKTADGLFAGSGTQPSDNVLELPIAGRGPVPGGTSAVTLNVTAIGWGTGFVTVYPCGTRPTTSSLNVAAGQIISNLVITKLSAAGTVCIYNQSTTDIVVDVFNILPAGAINALDTPARLLDTRPGQPTVDGQSAGAGPLGVNGAVEVLVAGRGGVDPMATSAVLNVTAVGAVTGGFLTVWPCDGPRPATSNINYTTSAPIPNAVVTALSARGTVCVFSSNPTNVVVDVFGTIGSSMFKPLTTAARLMDTRAGYPTMDGLNSGAGKSIINQITELPIGNRGGLAATVSAIVLNVTVDAPETAGYVTVYPCGTARPPVSNVNFAAGQTLPVLVVTKLSANATICLYTSSKTHVVIDVFASLNL